ncbi:DNA protecting protein DprA [Chloroherpeton thalassium ATCC 35110]|uniref:DNA protecting protein DprA n=1 Tax=Chloroherpeton thalassium (strain ATCC 35110 / GB-78) TaxID=517418 RepID=B3QVN1_CHLT3|nr:DNA-processing protein DprA [Chloroherpeton thalassium]ACF13088.1 DNA protecting protein DprA [Chloroherpeton thalassium ATCC 35110]
MMASPNASDFGKHLSFLILSQIPSIGSHRLRSLLAEFSSHREVFSASPERIRQLAGFSEKLGAEICAFGQNKEKMALAEAQAYRQFELMEKYHARLMAISDADYPALLKQIYTPPAYLFVRGSLTPEDSRSLAVVGTRQATDYGKKATRKLCQGLVANRMTIVSGLAYGIDMTAHQAALEAGGRTLAVLACGVDNIYTDPKGKIYPAIIENGALLSEEWLGSEITAEKFPKRNRIISGLSLGTLVVESDYKGGALITAAYALDQNREVFAVPGNIFAKKANGTNSLIRDAKAKLVLSAEDILNELQPHTSQINLFEENGHRPLPPQESLSQEESDILALINASPIQIDELVEKSGMAVSDLQCTLFELELKHQVEQLPGKFFKRIA